MASPRRSPERTRPKRDTLNLRGCPGATTRSATGSTGSSSVMPSVRGCGCTPPRRRLGRRRADDWRAAVTVVGRRGHVLVGLTRCYRRLARKVGTSGCVPVVFFPARSRGGPTGRVNASPVQSWTPKRPHSRDTRVRSEVLRPLPWSPGLPGCLVACDSSAQRGATWQLDPFCGRDGWERKWPVGFSGPGGVNVSAR